MVINGRGYLAQLCSFVLKLPDYTTFSVFVITLHVILNGKSKGCVFLSFSPSLLCHPPHGIQGRQKGNKQARSVRRDLFGFGLVLL